MIPELLINSPNDFLESLKEKTKNELYEFGLGYWPLEKDHLWLFPKDWYDYIPENYIVTDIFGMTEPFHKNISSRDCRCGSLAYGIKIPKREH